MNITLENGAIRTQFGLQPASDRTPVRVGVGVIVVDDRGQFVLEKRGDCGLWGLPGGRIEPGESITAAAVREVKEETGLKVKVISLVGVYSAAPERLVTYPGETEPVHLVDIILAAKIVSGKLQPSAESEAVAFFSPKKLPDGIAPPARAPLLDFARGLSGVIQ